MLSSFTNPTSFWDDFLGRPITGQRRPLQLQRRGNFFNDSLFHDTRSHFDSAVRDIVKDFNFSKRDNDLASYRLLRDRHLTGADRAATLTEEQDKFKIVMDVHGFIENDLKVTFLNDNELIIEGQMEKKDEVSLSRQTFKRRFLLPGKINVNETTSALSSDHVLTIVIPKQLQAITANTETNTGITEIKNEEISNLQQAMGSLSMNNQQTSHQIQEQQSQTKKESNFESALQSFPELPIVQKQDFFGDSFFDNVRGQFQNRIKEIMDRRFEKTEMEDLNIYKKFREKDNKENNVAVTVSGDSKEHKIVLDVHGFSEGDIKVKAVNTNELLVEGKVEKKSDNSYCKNSFKRSFYLPDTTDIRQTASALSSDGVLTIIVPKQEKLLPLEYSIPITREETTRKTSQSKTVTAKSSQETQSQERIVPIALGYKDSYISSIQEEKKEQSSQLASSPFSPATEVVPQQKLNQQESLATKMIPISLAGSFFKDSVFDTAKHRVETAIRDAMSRSNSVTSEKQTVSAPQEVQPSAPKQVVSSTFAEDATSYKINLDVYGYKENELRIKTYPNNEVVIEGNASSKKEGCTSNQTFQKRFKLPDYVLVDRASSALSSESMLTITMPKKQVQQPLPSSEHIIPVCLEGVPRPQPAVDTQSSISTVSDVASVQSSIQQDQTKQREFVVPLEVGKEARSLQSQQVDSSSLSQAVQKVDHQTLASESLFDSDFFKDVPTKIHSDLAIAPRGLFYQDAFFNDSRDMFESALKGTMNRFSSFPTFTDDMNFYKSLREQRINAETPTEVSAEDQQFHKIVLDVQGYSEDDLKLQVLEGNGLCVEGKTEEKGQGSFSSRTFKKCFFLPAGFKMSEASTGLSADGVLTIKVPKSSTQAIAF